MVSEFFLSILNQFVLGQASSEEERLHSKLKDQGYIPVHDKSFFFWNLFLQTSLALIAQRGKVLN